MHTDAIVRQKDIVHGEEPKILYCDLEISPMLGWVYGAYETNVLRIEQAPKIISIAWQWEGEKKIHALTLNDFSAKQSPYNLNDREIARELHDLMEEAHIIVGHNWDAFDMKTANARFLALGMAPIPPHKTVDTLKKARSHFRMPKNNLDEIYRYIFQKDGKTKLKHSDVVWDCIINNDPKYWKLMAAYNKRDVEITREVYLAMRPFYKTHPNISYITREDVVCTKCQSDKVERRGKEWLKAGFRWKWQCQTCHSWFRTGLMQDLVEPVSTV